MRNQLPVFAFCLLAACGGGGGGGNVSPAPASLQALADATPSVSGSCSNGAMSIRIGLDANVNGALDAGEVSYTQVVCTAGEAGWLVSFVDEAPGPNCATGGQRALVGRDADGDGRLQVSEATASTYLCNGREGVTGPAGSRGATGDDGANSLLAVTAEPPGAHCASGGNRVQSGLDGDRDGILAPGEATQTVYVCHGANGADGAAGASGSAGADGSNGANGFDTLLVTQPEPAGANCAQGGSRVQNGLDANRNGVLDLSEVAQTAYVCNPPPAGITWVSVAGDTVATANTGYLVTSAFATDITLPVDPPTGSVVRVNGLGSGGWRVAQQAGQFVHTLGLPASARHSGQWTARPEVRSWLFVASSADGANLAAVALDAVFTSRDYGATWTQRGTLLRGRGVASSADGRRLVVLSSQERIRVSDDYGLTWIERDSPRAWQAVASSATGQVLLAAADQLYLSFDYGVTWSPASGSHPSWAVAVSATGRYMLAPENGGEVWMSSDFGATWTHRTITGLWVDATMSADGRLMATADHDHRSIFVSPDYGETWIPGTARADWFSVAAAADGSVLVGAANGGDLYTSMDEGTTWSPLGAGTHGWTDLACSTDCGRILASAGLGDNRLFTSPTTTTVGTAGGLAGGAASTVELQYVGGGAWTILSHEGTVRSR